MPLFSNKFSPKSIPVRKQDTTVLKSELGSDYASKELSLDVGPLKLKLGDFEISFEEGQWIPGKWSKFILCELVFIYTSFRINGALATCS